MELNRRVELREEFLQYRLNDIMDVCIESVMTHVGKELRLEKNQKLSTQLNVFMEEMGEDELELLMGEHHSSQFPPDSPREKPSSPANLDTEDNLVLYKDPSPCN